MIQKISADLSVHKISFKLAEKQDKLQTGNTLSSQFDDITKNGLDATAAYNIGLMYAKDKNIKKDENPLEPIWNSDNINEIKGEKIYNHNGKLQYVIIRDEDTIEYYVPDKDDESKLEEIRIIDKKTGKLLEKQTSYREEDENGDEYKVLTVQKFSPENSNNYREAEYINGELRATSNETDTNGKIANVFYDYQSKTYSINHYNTDDKNDMRINVNLNENKQIQSYEEYVDDTGINLVISYFNGTPISYNICKQVVLPSDAGKDKLTDPNIKPAEKEEKPKNLRKIEGEKTYYSNGALESNTFDYQGKKIKALFNDDGTLTKISTDDKEIEFDGEKQVITEKFDNNVVRITEFSLNGKKFVTLKDNNTKMYKSAYYDNGNKIYHYQEGKLIENDKTDLKKSLWFNEEGNLTEFYNFGD